MNAAPVRGAFPLLALCLSHVCVAHDSLSTSPDSERKACGVPIFFADNRAILRTSADN